MIDTDWEGRATYLIIITGSLGGGVHQCTERGAWSRIVRGSSEGAVGMKSHGGAWERFGARLVDFLPVYTSLATLP